MTKKNPQSKTFKKFRFPFSWQTVYYGVFFFCIVALLVAVVFSYRYITSTILYTTEAIRLKKIVAPDSFQKEDFDAILKRIEEKKTLAQSLESEPVINIFSLVHTPEESALPPAAEMPGSKNSTPPPQNIEPVP